MTSKFGLVIANTEYQDASFAKLTAPGKDAEEFAQILQDAELAAFDDVQILINEGEGKTRRSIARFFAERKPADLLLLYFSGHGVRNEQGQLFLAANDTEINILDATGIPAEFITRAMNNSRSQRQLLILDCCNSGAFAHGSKSTSGIGKSMGIATAFEGDGYGRVVLTATDATQFAWEGDKVIGDTQKSVFTHFLIEGLKGEADRDGDGRIKVDELYDYAYEQVVLRTPKQTPGKWSYRQQGDIILRDNLRMRDVKPAPLASDLLEVLAHSSSFVRSSGVQELIRLLDGRKVGLARAAEEKLREIASNDDSLTLRKLASDTLSARGIMSEQSIEILKESLSVGKPAVLEIREQERQEAKRIEKNFVPPQNFFSSLRRRVQGSIQLRKLSERKSAIPKLDKLLLGRILGISVVIALIGWAGTALINNWPSFNSPAIATSTSNQRSTIILQATITDTAQPPVTNTASPTGTTAPLTQTPTSALGVGSTIISDKDGMILLYVPAGEFTMGSVNGGVTEKPSHTAFLDAFWIDQTEVTNKMYSLCVTAGVCQSPKNHTSSTRPSYYGNSNYDNFPVIYVNWDMAKTYCSWADRRLPTEAEWEKAARGDDAHDYPWGNSTPDTSLANYNNAIGDTADVGNYTRGASPYGALDMAGNVSEWVLDWFSQNYYESSPYSNPLGPNEGSTRVLRGGAWPTFCQDGFRSPWSGRYLCFDSESEYPPISLYSWRRKSDSPDVAYNFYGFRCALSE